MNREENHGPGVEVSSEEERVGVAGQSAEPGSQVPAEEAGDTAVAAEEAERPSYEELEQKLAEATAKASENWDMFLRARADIENLRRRSERELENAHKFALERFVKDLLPVVDSFELGVTAASDEEVDAERLREGAELTLKQLKTVLERHAIVAIDPKDERFDPERHQAMTMQESSQVEPNTVLSVIQKGYLLNDRLVRPALVVVSRAAERGNEQASEEGT